jgi:tetratricopeptide (TPR) repeat protein
VQATIGRFGLMLVIIFMMGSALFAQDTTPEATPPGSPTQAGIAPVPDYVATAVNAAERAEIAIDEVEEGKNQAFNLLGVFEAIGFFVTIAAGVGAVAGVSQLFTARSELEKTRKQLEQEASDLRQRFEDEIQKREQDFMRLQQAVQAAAREQGEITNKALLANALMPLGERQYKTGDYLGALSTYQRAKDLDRDNPVVNQRLGYVYTQRGDLENAKLHYETAIDREPNFAPALAGLGFVYRRLGEQVDKVVAKMTDASDAVRVEKIIERDRLFNRAEDLLLHALQLSPRLVDDDGESWWGVVGGLYKRRGQIDQALEAYRQVTIYTPESSYGFGNLALLYLKKNMLADMLKTYERVEQIAANEAVSEQGNFWGYADLIVSRYALGKAKDAREVLPMAMSIAPADSPYMLSGLAETLAELLNILPEERKPAIQEAIKMIETHLATQRVQ